MSRKTIKIYINNIPLVISNEMWNVEFERYYIHFMDRDESTLDRVIDVMETKTLPPRDVYSIRAIYLQCNNPKEIFENFKKRFNYIEAAGGLVLNDKGKVLMIHRLGVWDLPKGKIEKGETARKAAIREIKEECGIGKLKIIKELPSTYHIYEMKGKKYLKRTHWFMMICIDDTKPVPQTEENIDEVRWMSKTRMKGINSRNTYGSILDVLSNLKK